MTKDIWKNIYAVVFGLALFIVMVAVFELILGFVFKPNEYVYKKRYPVNYSYFDEHGIRLINPGTFKDKTVIRNRQTKEEKPLYDITISINEHGNRITPVENRQERTQQALFFGCSFTFGEGVEDDQTVPYYFAKYANQYVPYNMGYHGDGPFDVLTKVENYDIQERLDFSQGKIFYIIVNAHLYRLKGDMREMGWGFNRPYYEWDDGRITRNGNFDTGRPFLTRSLHFLEKTNIMRVLNKQRFLPVTEHDYLFMAETIKRIFTRFDEQFPKFEKYLVFYPENQKYNMYYHEVIKYLEDSDIKILNYDELFDQGEEQYQIVGDGHPTPLANELVAKQLVKDLELNK